jgi:hypothetical protein
MTEALWDSIKDDPRAVAEFDKMRFELAWRHFDLHARQRTLMFHFFIILTPFLFGGCFILFREREIVGPWPGIVAALAGGAIGLVFFLLDRRNRQLYRVAKTALTIMEAQLLFASYRPLRHAGADYCGVISKEEELYGKKCVIKHGTLMGVVYWMAIILFLALAGYFFAVERKYVDLPAPSTTPKSRTM